MLECAIAYHDPEVIKAGLQVNEACRNHGLPFSQVLEDLPVDSAGLHLQGGTWHAPISSATGTVSGIQASPHNTLDPTAHLAPSSMSSQAMTGSSASTASFRSCEQYVSKLEVTQLCITGPDRI